MGQNTIAVFNGDDSVVVVVVENDDGVRPVCEKFSARVARRLR